MIITWGRRKKNGRENSRNSFSLFNFSNNNKNNHEIFIEVSLVKFFVSGEEKSSHFDLNLNPHTMTMMIQS
jgi:hypothetical protein